MQLHHRKQVMASLASHTSCQALQPTMPSNQPLLTISSGKHQKMVTFKMLSTALALMLDILSPDSSLYSLHSLHRGGATTTYRVDAQQMNIKCHGLLASDTFWINVTSPCAHHSPVAEALVGSVAAAQ